MNKKRFLLFLITFILIISIPVLYFILKQPKFETVLHTASNLEEVEQFYYRAVPGLKQAEEAGLVRDINKQLAIPGQETTLIIDKIWYNRTGAIIFYHVQGANEAVYLGGEFYLPTDEPAEKRPYHGDKSIGSADEKGIIYDGSFYSCLKLSPLYDSSGQPVSEIETLTFTPFINQFNTENNNQLESILLKSFDVALNYNQEDEAVTKFPVDSQIGIEDKHLRIYQVDVSPSVNRIYFQYLNSGRDKVYRIKGSYTTDKGEFQTFDVFPTVITDYPYHYIIEVPPFHIVPDTVHVEIESLICVGSDSISFKLETDQFGNRNRSYETEIGKNRIRGTDIYIRNVTLKDNFVEIYITFMPDNGTETRPLSRVYPLSPVWVCENSLLKDKANYLTVYNSDYQMFNIDNLFYGSDILPEDGICLRLDRKFWNESNTIYLHINNLTYSYEINKSTPVTLEEEQDSGSE